jgi:hypothetical protein
MSEIKEVHMKGLSPGPESPHHSHRDTIAHTHTQIVGSFVILNGTINALKYVELPTSIPTAF